MSVPLSLRLCCAAAMAPALTETTGQQRLQLPGSPPPVVSESDNLNISLSNTKLTSATIKSKVALSADLPGTRGLLTPVHSNGFQRKLLTEKFKKGLEELGLPAKITGSVEQLTNKETPDEKSGELKHTKITSKKMNQPSNGNGPNGTGRRFIKHSSLLEEKALNGHKNYHTESKFNFSKNLIDSCVQNSSNSGVSSLTKKRNMCQTTESGTGPLAPTSSVQNHNGTNLSNKSEALLDRSGTLQLSSVSFAGRKDNAHDVDLKPTDTAKDAARKEFMLERRSQFLLRRLRRLQGHQLESHVKTQLKSFVDFHHQHLQTVASNAIRPFSENAFFNCNDVKNLSTSNLVTLVRKLQASQPKPVMDTSTKNNKKGVLVMEQGVSSETERKSGFLRTNVRHWNDAVDTEETESSSGGESCEEWEDCPVMSDKKVPTPLHKRAEWKWAVDRASIVARWTWLQAQVSDLEYRIRQQSEIYKTIRNSKGVVTLCDPPVAHLGAGGDAASQRVQEMSPANVAALMINVNKQASKLQQSLGDVSPIAPQGLTTDKVNKDSTGGKSLNGYVEGSHTPQSACASATSVSCDNSSVTVSPDLNNHALDASCVAARCRPVRFYRKRKLLRTAGLHQVSHKAARLSSVKCQCYPPVMSCPMCGGRYNNVQHLDAEGMPIMEKVSLLDPAFHPVLSFPQEIGLTLHFEALLKSGEWQSSKPQPKHTLRSLAAEKRHQKLLNAQLKEQARKKRKYNKAPAAVLLSSAKLRSKYDGKSPNKTSKKTTAEARLRRKEMKRRRAAQLAAAALKKTVGDNDIDSGSSLSHTPSPSPQMKDGTLSHSASSSTLKDQKDARKKRFENAYDINNIVIPYSMAASTRVEKLKYKEIQTPKWREVDHDEKTEQTAPEPMDTDPDSTEVEDLSDEAFLNRHETAEAEERKRFRNFITYPPVRRSRLSRESESNTLESIPSDLNLHDSGSQCDLQASFQSSFSREEGRRRSSSTSITSRRGSFLEEYMSHITHDSFDREHLDPFPPRYFPLSDEVYEDMKKEQLTVSETKHSYRTRTVRVQDDPSMEFISPEFDVGDSEPQYIAPSSPVGSRGSSVSVEDENDPEWNERHGDRRSSISMRHSKR